MNDVRDVRVVLATHNRHKLAELQEILGEVLSPEQVASAADLELVDVVEDGVTFAENALLKARYVARRTGRIAVADDSGLSVDVLGGAPGIFSARWSGRHGDDSANLQLLLAQLSDIPDAHRAAGFICAAAMVVPRELRPDGQPLEVVELGELRGRLLRQPRGDSGFGYDPILQPTGEERSCAELSPAEKNAISHRGRAFRRLVPHLQASL